MNQLPGWITAVPVGPLATNCYVLFGGQGGDAGETGGDAAIVDPGDNPRAIERILRARNAKPGLVLLTHGHGDHWGALPDLLRSYPDCVVAASEPAMQALASVERNLSAWVGSPMALQPAHQLPITDGDRVHVGLIELSVIATPGHTPGCICFYVAAGHPPVRGAGPAAHEGGGPVLFSGDTLFRDSAGRTDLPGGSRHALEHSLRKLAALPSATLVLPGHGGHTTMQREVAGNEYLRRAIRS